MGGGDALQITSRGDAVATFAQDEAESLDVNSDGNVTALDALMIINSLSVSNAGSLSDGHIDEMDVNGDDNVSVLDALRVVNHLGKASVSSQGEHISAPTIAEQTKQRELDEAVQGLATTSSPTVDRQEGERPIDQYAADALRSRAILEWMDEAPVDADVDEALAADITTNRVESSQLF